MDEQLSKYLPILIYLVFVLGFVVTNLVLAHVVGPWKKSSIKQLPYESGMDPVGDARQHFDVKFYLIAVLFLVFDVELVLLYPWAVSAYSEPGVIAPMLRTAVFLVVLGFLAKLTLAYAYEWRKGGFKWR